MSIFEQLSRREREVMEILYARGDSTMGEIAGNMTDPPTRPALRSVVKILEEKGHLVPCGKRGREHLFRTSRVREEEGQAAWKKVLSTFFSGSMKEGLAAYLNDPEAELSEDELKTIESMLRDARRTKNQPSPSSNK